MGSSSKMIEATAEGQVVIAIDVEPIEKDLRTDVTELSAAREIGVRVQGRSYRAVLTPDLEAGSKTARGPAMPRGVNEGETLAETRRTAPGRMPVWRDTGPPPTPHRPAHSPERV